jgi:hypothetical protein
MIDVYWRRRLLLKNKDIIIRSEIEEILQGDLVGQHLKSYFGTLPAHQIRRAMTVLVAVYPDKTMMPDDEFDFILFMFSQQKFLQQENFFEFIRSLNIIDFTENQKSQLIKVIKADIVRLSEICTFELDELLMRLFNHYDLFEYFKVLAKERNKAVLQHILATLRYEDFSYAGVPQKVLEKLKQEASRQLKGS